MAPGDVVFDVGANMGNRSKVFRRLGAEVVGFEPQRFCARFLAAAFATDTKYTLVEEGLSDAAGELVLRQGREHTLATVDGEWLERVQGGARFPGHEWARTDRIKVTTLDAAIARFGLPRFVKIDVEGHELAVLQGLHQPVAALSIEFASEAIDRTRGCIDRLMALGDYRFNVSSGESMEFDGPAWLDRDQVLALLAELVARDPVAWGDVYARREPAAPAGGTVGQ